MEWHDVMSAVNHFSAAETKEYMDSHSSADFQLVDVRQPAEYTEGHLPGAILLPLIDLITSKSKLDKKKPTIVYCRGGNRSIAAAQWMSRNGYTEIHNVLKGILGWYEKKATGFYNLNLNLLGDKAVFSDAVTMAYAMEDGLKSFYQSLARSVENEDQKQLLLRLVSFEDLHMTRLRKSYSTYEDKNINLPEKAVDFGNIIEGGGSPEGLYSAVMANLNSMQDIFELSMALETQAYDFYARLANKSSDKDIYKFFMEMADEEKEHLNYLTKEMEKYLGK